jgi:hypothetical protein
MVDRIALRTAVAHAKYWPTESSSCLLRRSAYCATMVQRGHRPRVFAVTFWQIMEETIDMSNCLDWREALDLARVFP